MQKFYEFLEEHLKNKFEYGELDCAVFAAKSVLVMRELPELQELLERIEGGYDNEEDGLSILHEWLDEKNIQINNPFEDVLNYLFGEPVSRLEAATGDVVLGDWGEGESFGIVEGARVVAVSDNGLVRLRLNKARLAWKIGEQG